MVKEKPKTKISLGARWKKIPKRTKKQICWVIGVLIVMGGYVFWDVHFGGPLTSLFNNRDKLIEIVRRAGIWGPIIYTVLQFMQTVVAPIPGGATGPIGGFLFGWMGVIWTLVGTTLAAALIFAISKRYGRNLALKVLGEEQFKKFDMIPEDRAEMVIFALFLIPGLPDDAICYLAGVTKVPIERLLVCWAIGRIPAVVMANYIGMGIEEGNFGGTLVALGIATLLMGFVAIKHKEIMEALKNWRTKSQEKNDGLGKTAD